MIIHLDTNVIALAFDAGTPAAGAMREWFAQGHKVDICSIVWAEYLCGPILEVHRTKAMEIFRLPNRFLLATQRAAQLFNGSGRRKHSLADCLIAAVAIRCQVPLATADLAGFRAYAPFGLQLLEIP